MFIGMKNKYEEIRHILAQNIKSRREFLGLTQENLAEAAELSVQTINTIEGCRMWISDKSITRLAKALDMDIFQLFVPYNLNKNELNNSFTTILLELRQKAKTAVDNLHQQLDSSFNEALKYPVKKQIEKEKKRKS